MELAFEPILKINGLYGMLLLSFSVLHLFVLIYLLKLKITVLVMLVKLLEEYFDF